MDATRRTGLPVLPAIALLAVCPCANGQDAVIVREDYERDLDTKVQVRM